MRDAAQFMKRSCTVLYDSSWLNGLFKKGYNKTLEFADLYDVCQEDSSEVLGNDIEK